ncbi:MAG TPA: hypothetical protein PKE32_00655 [Miltoncostaeaceae bacterium]|nr:hypothetical protein [Miltoncostaeaceae bacterium]
MRRVLDVLDRADRPLTVQEIADSIRRHHTGVRPQLAALVRAGVVEARVDPPKGRGRPATRYALAGLDPTETAAEHQTLLALVRSLTKDHDFSEEDVERFGESHGHMLAHPDSGADDVRRQFTALGFTPRTIPGRPGALRLAHCPFADRVREPGGELICIMHRGLTRGLAQGSGLSDADLEIGPPSEGRCCVSLERSTTAQHPER